MIVLPRAKYQMLALGILLLKIAFGDGDDYDEDDDC